MNINQLVRHALKPLITTSVLGLNLISATAALASDDHAMFSNFLLDRFEYEGNDKLQLFNWDMQEWVGDDIHKLVVKSEGDYSAGQGIFGRADLQLLYSRNISTFWDVQVGARRAFEPERTYDAVIGFQGLAPHFIKVDASMFLTNNGNVLGRINLGYELLITQRLILEPTVELNLAANDIHNRGVKSGITEFEAGMRLRYEIKREFAPYIGFDYVEEPSLLEHQHGVRVVTGLRVWY